MPRSSIALLLIVLGAALGARVWFAFSPQDSALAAFVGRTSVVEGIVTEDPDYRASSVRVVVDVAALNTQNVHGRILAVLPRETQLQYGDTLTLHGSLEEPQTFETQSGRTFDYPGYLRARGVEFLMPHAAVRDVRAGEWGPLRALYALKHSFERALERVMQEPMASLMEGLLLGEKSGLPQALSQAFVIAGLIHIVVLSGYNIGVVAEAALRTVRTFLPRRAALLCAGIFIILFALMAGGGMATVRAAIMGLLAVLARYLNRPTAALRALFVAGAAMVLWNPLVLTDTGFILSILATFGLITIAPALERKLLFVPEGTLRSIAATTLAVQVFVLPALLYLTGVLSFISLPLNMLALPVVPLAMLLGFVAGLLALLHPALGLLPGFLSDKLLGALIFSTQKAASLPLAAFVVPPFPVWVVFVLYVPLVMFALRLYRSALPPQTN